jgi:DeoR/GlpR family transcriptional regulator of sugar metabolism
MALDGEVKLAELKEMFDVAEMTLRRDMEKLEQLGLLRRTFGGAILIGTDIALKDRTDVLLEEKMRIGRKAAQLVQPGDSVFIDGGSTTLQVAKYLPPKMNVTVVTNALNVASELLAKQIATIVIGGIALERTATLVGPIAAAALSKMAFHRVFLGTTGITTVHGFSNSNMYEAEIKQIAMAQSAEVNVVTDRTKFGKQDLFSFAALDKADRIITDSEPAGELLEAFASASVEIVV